MSAAYDVIVVGKADCHPAQREVIVMSPCSGHIFQLAPVLAECVADLVEDRRPVVDLSPFALSRSMRT